MSQTENSQPGQRGMAALAWWGGLQPLLPDGKPNQRADKGALAELRRADVDAALMHRATMALYQKLPGMRREDLPRVATLAAVLATARQHEQGMPLARRLGVDRQKPDVPPRLSPLRLQRLLRADTPEDQLLAFRRAIQLTGGAGFDLVRLSRDLLDPTNAWRRRWVFDYHDAGGADPGSTPPDAKTGDTAP